MKKLISAFVVCLFAAPLAFAAMHIQGTNQTSAPAASCDCCIDCKCESCVCDDLGCVCDKGGDCVCEAGCCSTSSCCTAGSCCVK